MARKKENSVAAFWAKAESLYESGEFNLEQIAEEFGVHPITVQRHMKANGIEKGSKAAEIKEKVTEKMKDAAEEDASIIAQRIRETKEEHYRLNQAIDKRIVREMVGVESEGRSIATSLGVFKALKTAAETLKLTRENRYTVLGIIDNDTLDDELPTLEVRDMLEEEIESIREQQRLQAEEMGLTTDESFDDDALEGAE